MTINPVTLEEVNERLLERLCELIECASGSELLDITEAVAKLNASRRNSDQFAKPESQEAKAERDATEALVSVMTEG